MSTIVVHPSPLYFEHLYNTGVINTPTRVYYDMAEYDIYEDDNINTDLICFVNHFEERVIAISKFDFASPYFNLDEVLKNFEEEPQNTICEEMKSDYLKFAFEDYDIIKIKDGVLYYISE